MTSREFCYWLQGYLEIDAKSAKQKEGLTSEQRECIEKHLNMVFHHEIDPSYLKSEELTKIHTSSAPDLNSTLIRC